MNRRARLRLICSFFPLVFACWALTAFSINAESSVVNEDYKDPVIGYLYGEAWENSTLELYAPDGHIFDGVFFASYGTPYEYAYEYCHAESSVQEVSNVFMGKSYGLIEASNSVFGDPCPGVFKKLVVVLTYSPYPKVTPPPVDTTLPPAGTTVPLVPPSLPPETTTPAPIPEAPRPASTTTTSQPRNQAELFPEITTTTQQQNNSTTTTIPEINTPEPTPAGPASAASNPAVLSVLTQSEAIELFSSLDTGALTDEEAGAIIAAVQDAPNSVREAFEDTVGIFSGKFDDYVMLGSTINVGDRRTMVAVSVVGAMGAAASAVGATATQAGRRNEEEEDSGPVGEIASDGTAWVKSISIYKTINGEKTMDWKKFTKKFAFGVMNLGFTISGSIVVYFTLSGAIQTIALYSMVAAFVAAMYLHMKEPEA